MAPAALPPDVAASRAGETLLWFSRGWLVRPASGPGVVRSASTGPAASGADAEADTLVVADPRFGRVGLGPEAPFVFSWAVAAEPVKVTTSCSVT